MAIHYHTIELNNTRTHYAEVPGEGPPLVILHGVTSSLETYAPYLTGDIPAHIYALDLRGHGQSANLGAASAYHLDHFAEDVIAFVNWLDQPVLLVGHSLGAVVAAWTASKASEQLQAVFLEDPPMYHILPDTPRDDGMHKWFVKLRDYLTEKQSVGATLEEMVDEVKDWAYSAQDRRPVIEVAGMARAQLWAKQLRSLDVAVLEAVVAATIAEGVVPEEFLPHIGCYTYLLAGDEASGGVIAAADVEKAATLIPDCQYEILDGVGHNIHRERPDLYKPRLEQFITHVQTI